jgi:hypothetical protein
MQNSMRKIYSLLSVTMLSALSFGQITTNTQTVGKMPSPVIKSSKKPAPASAAPKAVLYGPYTFGTPSDWSFNDNSSSGDNWVIGTAAPQGFYSDGMGAIASTTAANGFAMFDSDFLGEDDNGTSPQNSDIYFNTPVDLTGELAVAVEFESYYRAFQGDCYVIASTDGVTWTQVPVHLDVAVNASTANPVTVSANVSAIVGGSSTAYFGFRYIGTWDYAWMVDDVSIVTLPDNDLALTKGWHDDIITDYEYSRLPLTQVRELVVGVVVENQGGQNQTVPLTWEVFQGASSVASNTVNVTVNVAEIDTFWYNTGYTPDANGDYTVEFSIPADMDPTDDVHVTSALTVNDHIMAHDLGTAGTYGWNPTTSADNANEPHSWGNLYIPTVDQEIYGVDVNFATGTTSGLYFLVRVQQVPNGGSIQDPLTMINQIDFTVGPSNIGSSITTIAFPSPSMLTAGEAYIIDILKVDGTTGQGFFIGGSDLDTEDDDFSTVCYGPYGASDAVNYFVSWGFAPYVRANFNQVLSVNETNIEGVAVYPNPTTGVVNVTNANGSDNEIRVYDVTGKMVFTKNVTASTSFDLSQFGAGVYVVKVSNENGQLVERVVVR